MLAGLTQLAADKNRKKDSSDARQMDPQKQALHALNRLTFGPRRGDVERVTAMGVDKWIDLQLHPEKIDDGSVEVRLASLRTLRMDTKELVENFPPPQLIKASSLTAAIDAFPDQPNMRSGAGAIRCQ